MNSIIPGVAFGAAITASGVYKPQVILSQLALDDWQYAPDLSDSHGYYIVRVYLLSSNP